MILDLEDIKSITTGAEYVDYTGDLLAHAPHTEPAGAKSDALQIKIELLEKKSNVFQISVRLLTVEGNHVRRCP